MINAPVVRRHRSDHAVLLCSPLLFLQQFLLKRDALLQFLLFDSVLRFRLFPFQHQLRVPSVLRDDEKEQRQHNQEYQQ